MRVWSLVSEVHLWLLPVTRAGFWDRERHGCVSCTAFVGEGENVLDAYQDEQIII